MTQIYTRPIPAALHEQQPSVYERRTTQDSYTTPESHKSSALSSGPYSERRYQRNDWDLSPPHSITSDHKRGINEVPAARVGDMYQTRPETTQNSQREQLPPLSSLFGGPTQSPYSDRQSPVFPAVSPLDPRHPSTPARPDRAYDAFAFQRPATSHPYPYSKPEQVDRPGFQPPSLPPQVGGRPESPRYEPRYTPQKTTRTQQSPAVNNWSPQSQTSRQEPFSRDTSSSFRAHADQYIPQPPPLQRPEPEPRPTFRDSQAPATLNYPPTPASTVSGDATTTKDGLGPKIWTGTQFLPRFVRQAEVPGEGMCYFYDDGTHCKTVIDGEAVNAHWGVTKAGKPRKRLAIACITCREKKIKCDPDYPRCVQCEKFGRVCKFKNAPRGGQGSPDTPPAESEDVTPRPTSSRAEGESFKPEKREHSPSASPRPILRQITPDSEVHRAKRQRISYGDFTPVASEASPRPSREPRSPSTPWVEALGPSPMENNLLQDWQVNPYSTHPAVVSELLSLFYKYSPEPAAGLFPEGPFRSWVLSTSDRSLDDLMIIYTLLALGTVFSTKPEHKALGIRYAAISRYACDNRHFSIQLVHSRLLLAVYYFASNNPNDSWDFCGGAMRAASGLKLNVEIERSDDAFLTTFPYGLNRHGYAECRRRTFWCCYLMDRFHGFCSGHLSLAHSEDVFLRLPCDAESFDAQVETQSPFFDPYGSPSPSPNGKMGSLAYLIIATSIWGDVMANIYRTSQSRTAPANSSAFMAFYDKTTQRLRDWKDSLPEHYTFSTENLKREEEKAKLGTFIGMHSIYHTAYMKLNRYVPRSMLTPAQLTHHVSLATQHAEDLLLIMDAVASRRASLPRPPSPSAPLAAPTRFSSPFTGYAMVSAVDILTAQVRLSSVADRLASFGGVRAVLAELALFWQSARHHQALVLQRIQYLGERARAQEPGGAGAIGFKTAGATTGAWEKDAVAEMREPLEKMFARDFDCIYA